MAQPKVDFTPEMVRKLKEVGKKVETARLAKRLSIRAAAELSVTDSPQGHMSEGTWRRVERGAIQARGKDEPHRSKAITYMAVAEVVDIDGAELCRELGIPAPPPRSMQALGAARERAREDGHAADDPDGYEIRMLRRKVWELEDRLQRLERGSSSQ